MLFKFNLVTKQTNEILAVSNRRLWLQKIIHQDKRHRIDFANISKLVTTRMTMKLCDNLVIEALKFAGNRTTYMSKSNK